MRTMERILKIVCLCFTLITARDLLQAEEIDPKGGVADPGGNIVWYDCKLLAVEGKGWTNTASYYDRLPANARGKVPVSYTHLTLPTKRIV